MRSSHLADRMKKAYLGIDVGSITNNMVLLDEENRIIAKQYLRTYGQPLNSLQIGLKELHRATAGTYVVAGVGTTGSGRHLASILVGADVVKNEITSHAMAALNYEPAVRTIIEIGGQDSKVIFLREQVITEFNMNTICAAGTGSFLDQQAFRLGTPIEEFGLYALRAKKPASIAGRCTVFAESDMIHKQQMGYSKEDIIAGLCEALVRNYMNNLVKNRTLPEPILFQ